MHVFVLGVQANDTDDDFDLEPGYTTINQIDDQAAGYNDMNQQQQQQQKNPVLFSDHHHSKKYQPGKHISVQLFLGFSDYAPPPCFYTSITHTPAIYPAYRYLYFREINPPPPKAC
jgi:hypothetical protein